MANNRFLFVLAGLFLVLFAYAARAQSCSNVTIDAPYFDMAENDTDYQTVYVTNDSSDTFHIESIAVTDSSSYFDAEYDDRDTSTLEEGDTANVDIIIESFSVSSERTGQVTVKVSGQFDDGTDCSGNDISENFIVTVSNEGTDSTADCTDIEILSDDFSVDENKVSSENFEIENNSNSQFYVTDLQAGDSSSYFNITRDSPKPDSISSFSSSNIILRIDAEPVTTERSGDGYVKISGHFYNGVTCSFSDIGIAEFTVTVEDVLGNNCGAIELVTHTIDIAKDDTQIDSFTVRNKSNRTFTIDSTPQINEDSSYFEQSIDSFDSTIEDNSTGKIKIETVSENVTGTKTATSTLKVRGHFSDGNTCSVSDISKDFLTTVRDESSDDDDDSGSSGDCGDLTIESHVVEINNNAVATDAFFLRNSNSRNFYIDAIKAYDTDNSFATKELDFDRIAARNDGTAAINFRIESFDASNSYSGKAYLQVRGHYSNGTTCSYSDIGTKTFTVHITPVLAPITPAQQPNYPSTKMIEITNYPNRIEFTTNTFITVTVKNNSAFAKQVTFGFTGFPSEIMLETSIYSVPGSGTKTVYLDIDARENIGTFAGKLFIQSDNARDEKSIVIVSASDTTDKNASIQPPANNNDSGIIGSALVLLSETAAGIGVLVLVIIVLVLVLRKVSK